MTGLQPLTSSRICLRPWRDADRDSFAALNADARVMEFFRASLNRSESDAMADRIESHFLEHGFGLWAIEIPGKALFAGFAGLSWARFNAPFTPCVEIGWRLAFEHWGQGFATEAARLALDHAFRTNGLSEVVSFTSALNLRSRAVMARLGMRHDPAEDFDYPSLPDEHPLRRHVLYRLNAETFFATGGIGATRFNYRSALNASSPPAASTPAAPCEAISRRGTPETP